MFNKLPIKANSSFTYKNILKKINMIHPLLLTASSCFSPYSNKLAFSSKNIDPIISISNNDQTIEWTSDLTYAWVGVETELLLYNGSFSLDFQVESMKNYQLGVGFLLAWDIGNGEISFDWGFYGYLGSSDSAYAYDPSTGDIVQNTQSIKGNLPKLEKDSGLITLVLNLPAKEKGEAWFVIDGVQTPKIELPVGAVVKPAACLLRKGQKITLNNFVEIGK